MSNPTLFLEAAKAHPMVIKNAEIPKPEGQEVVVRVRSVAINPVDFGVQTMGLICEEFPAILGIDMAGEVTDVGPEVTDLEVGDRVLGCSNNAENEHFLDGTFRHYAKSHRKLISKIPSNIAYSDATVLPLGIATAATGLFDKRCMGLDLPRIGAKSTDSTLVVWGGASSVGSCAIQLARGAGYSVITTASSKNFDHCRELGAEEVFDYNSETVVEDIVSYLKDKKSAGVFNAIMHPSTLMASNEIADRVDGFKHVGTVFPPGFPLPPSLPKSVTTTLNYGTWLRDNEVGQAVFVDWVAQALANGDLKCKPNAQVLGKGLDKIQDAVDLMGKGVSASKLVVEID